MSNWYPSVQHCKCRKCFCYLQHSWGIVGIGITFCVQISVKLSTKSRLKRKFILCSLGQIGLPRYEPHTVALRSVIVGCGVAVNLSTKGGCKPPTLCFYTTPLCASTHEVGIKTKARNFLQAFGLNFVGVTRFELATPRPPDVYSNRTNNADYLRVIYLPFPVVDSMVDFVPLVNNLFCLSSLWMF